MRIPGAKVYRAFPELDPFDDVQCRRYVRLAKGKRWYILLGVFLLQIALVLIAIVATIMAFGFIEAVISDMARLPPWWAEFGAYAGAIVVVFGGFLLFILTLRDAALLHAIRRQLRGVACHQCEYSLIGLTPAEGQVRCPECGFTLVLEKYGLTNNDFLASTTP